eukprot:4955739-Amphidinium_carterae.1
MQRHIDQRVLGRVNEASMTKRGSEMSCTLSFVQLNMVCLWSRVYADAKDPRYKGVRASFGNDDLAIGQEPWTRNLTGGRNVNGQRRNNEKAHKVPLKEDGHTMVFCERTFRLKKE